MEKNVLQCYSVTSWVLQLVIHPFTNMGIYLPKWCLLSALYSQSSKFIEYSFEWEGWIPASMSLDTMETVSQLSTIITMNTTQTRWGIWELILSFGPVRDLREEDALFWSPFVNYRAIVVLLWLIWFTFPHTWSGDFLRRQTWTDMCLLSHHVTHILYVII